MDQKTTAIKKGANSMELLKASQVAELLGRNWSRSMVHTYLKRGIFPEPFTKVGKQPLWTREQIEIYKKIKGLK